MNWQNNLFFILRLISFLIYLLLILFRMTFTADTYGEDFLESGELDLYEEDPENPCNIRSECALGMNEIYSNLGWNLRASPNVCLFCILQVGPRGELLQ